MYYDLRFCKNVKRNLKETSINLDKILRKSTLGRWDSIILAQLTNF